jgi:phosphoserine aminotransferase
VESGRYIWTSGHRSGGYRASMYNALPIESVQVLVDVMQALESKSITKQDHDWDS